MRSDEEIKRIGWRKVPSPPGLTHCSVYQHQVDEETHFTVCVGREPDHHGVLQWHLSASIRDNKTLRYIRRPSREEMEDIRRTFLPDEVLFVEFFPPPHLYPASNPMIYQLWEVPRGLWQ